MSNVPSQCLSWSWHLECMELERKAGYATALDAAREAVAAVEQDPDAQVDYHRDYEMDQTGNTRNPRAWLRSSLAAIDALKEKP